MHDHLRAGGRLSRRLLAAFVVVALSSVLVLTLAALIATDRGLASVQRAGRARAAARAAEAAAAAYAQSGTWSGADLSRVSMIADAVGARLVVRDTSGTIVWLDRGYGRGRVGTSVARLPAAAVEAPVLVDGQQVGTVRLAFSTAAGGRTVVWAWVLGAGVVALIAALTVSGLVTRWLTRPLVALATAARRFAAGQRDARAAVAGPREVAAVAEAFNGMADETVRAEQTRRNLAADVAHELRTPLAALQAGLEELRDGLREPDAASLAALHDQSLRLGRVVQDLAELSAAEAAALSLRPAKIDLAEVARAALSAQRPALESAGLDVAADLDRPLPVHGDPDRLYQAIANLLANTARYCRPGDHVNVRGFVEAGSVVVEVADTGPGIPAEELPHIFDRLWRGQRARPVSGSGIGLAVVRELVAAHGGSVSAASGDGPGTVLTIRLPLAPALAATGPTSAR